MVVLVCWNCNQEIEVKFLEDIVNCPRCGETISREVQNVSQKGQVEKEK